MYTSKQKLQQANTQVYKVVDLSIKPLMKGRVASKDNKHRIQKLFINGKNYEYFPINSI